MGKAREGRAALLLTLVGACQADPWNLPDDVRWSSPHFVYHTRTGDGSGCEGVLAELERHFATVQSALGFSWPQGRVVDYYKFDDRADYEANARCPSDFAACTRGHAVRTWKPFHHHELIHAYLGHLGDPPPFLSEGIAQALSCGPEVHRTPSVSWEVAVTARSRDAAGAETSLPYTAGPWFVAHLIHRHGPDPFLRLHQAIPFDASAAEFARHFQAVYGRPVDVVWDEAVAAGASNVGCVHAWECSRPPTALEAGPVRLTESCAEGPSFVTFDVVAGQDLVWTDALVPSGFALKSCAPTSVAQLDWLGGLGPDSEAGATALPPGRHFITSRLGSGQVALRPQVGVLTEACPSPGTFPVPAVPSLAVAVPNGANSWHFTLRHDGPHLLRALIAEGSGVFVERCERCAEGCAPFPAPPGDLTVTGDTAIRIIPPTRAGYTIVKLQQARLPSP